MLRRRNTGRGSRIKIPRDEKDADVTAHTIKFVRVRVPGSVQLGTG